MSVFVYHLSTGVVVVGRYAIPAERLIDFVSAKLSQTKCVQLGTWCMSVIGTSTAATAA